MNINRIIVRIDDDSNVDPSLEMEIKSEGLDLLCVESETDEDGDKIDIAIFFSMGPKLSKDFINRINKIACKKDLGILILSYNKEQKTIYNSICEDGEITILNDDKYDIYYEFICEMISLGIEKAEDVVYQDILVPSLGTRDRISQRFLDEPLDLDLLSETVRERFQKNINGYLSAKDRENETKGPKIINIF